MSQAQDNESETTRRGLLVHQQILKLSALVAIAVGAFFLTAAVAARNRVQTIEDAAVWYAEGERRLYAGNAAAAIDEFRKAATLNRSERRYVLALSEALARNGRYRDAKSALERLRDQAPDDPDLNLRLARLEDRSGNPQEAVRYFHNALYAPWTEGQAPARRAARLELVNLLLAHDDVTRADAELLALSSDAPPTAAAHVELGRLFDQAHDLPHAREQYLGALAIEPGNRAAIEGVGLLYFQSGDYVSARRYLRSVEGGGDRVRHVTAVSEAVLSLDPLTRGISSSERAGRLRSAFDYVTGRLPSCPLAAPPDPAEPDGPSLATQIEAFRKRLDGSRRLDADGVEAGADLIDRAAHTIMGSCTPPTVTDEALERIARRHEEDQR